MNIRLLKFVVIAMGLLIVAGVTIVGATIVKRVAARSETTAPPERIAVSLPDGARIVETVLDGDRMALRVATANGERILIVDLATGDVLSTVAFPDVTP